MKIYIAEGEAKMLEVSLHKDGRKRWIIKPYDLAKGESLENEQITRCYYGAAHPFNPWDLNKGHNPVFDSLNFAMGSSRRSGNENK